MSRVVALPGRSVLLGAPRPTEAAIQAAIVDFLRFTRRQWLVLHIANSQEGGG